MNRIIIILSALALLTSCIDKTAVQEEGERSIMLRTMTKASGMVSDAEQTPVFMFWLDPDHEKFGTEDILPYFASRPDGVVDDYKTIPYDTGYPYPENTMVYANGYCPSLLTVDEGDGIRPYTSLSVPESFYGILDITATEGFVHGSAASPFEADDAQTMVFRHLQSKVNFYAKLGDIPAERFFRGVSITVPGKDVFTSRILWTDDSYHASETTSSEEAVWIAEDSNPNQMDPNEITPRKIGSVYIHPGQDKISFLLELQMSETVTFDSHEVINTAAVVNFKDAYGTATTLEAGEEYDITITILYDSFVFKGKKAEWQEGGKIPLPF